MVIDLVSKLPEDTSLEAILDEIEMVAGIKRGLAQAKRREGISIEKARLLVKEWSSESL